MSENIYYTFDRTNSKERMTKTDDLNTIEYFIIPVDLRDPKWDSCIKNKEED